MKDYLNELKNKLTTWDAQIKEFELAAIHATDPKKEEEGRMQAAELRERRQELEDKIKEIERLSGEPLDSVIFEPLQKMAKKFESKLDSYFQKK